MKKKKENTKEESKKTLKSLNDEKVDTKKVKGGGILGGRALVD